MNGSSSTDAKTINNPGLVRMISMSSWNLLEIDSFFFPAGSGTWAVPLADDSAGPSRPRRYKRKSLQSTVSPTTTAAAAAVVVTGRGKTWNFYYLYLTKVNTLVVVLSYLVV